jgi:hypothetical protein
MPPTDTRTGDTRRDPHALLVAAALLLLLRAGVTVWEENHPPAPPDGIGGLTPQSAPRMIFSGSATRRAP